MNAKIIDIAFTQYGIQEVSGETDNPEVLKYFNEIGFDGESLKDETAWCAAFANWVCKQAGCDYSGKLNARSFLTVGEKVTAPKAGDIVVLWRGNPSGWKGHVGFFIRETDTHIYMLGGNQGNQVCIAPYDKKRLLEYRSV